MSKPILTYCILHYNKLDKLKNTIKHIEKYTPIPFQVYIWNNGYINSKIKRYLNKLENKPEYNVIYSDKNLGCPPARNKLLKLVNTKYIFTIDDDMYIQDETIVKAIKAFENDGNVGGISFPQYDKKLNLISTSGILAVSYTHLTLPTTERV